MEFNVATKDSLIQSFDEMKRQVVQTFDSIPESDFIKRSESGWTAFQNLDHLNRSVVPVIKAMKVPRFVLQMRFGKSQKPSRSYTEVKETYLATLAQGAKAGGAYLPAEPGASKKLYLLNRWNTLISELTRLLDGWSETDLDRVLLPHPLLGKMTVREILAFTLYHSLHHSVLKQI